MLYNFNYFFLKIFTLQDIPYTNLLFASLKREPVYMVFSHIRRTYITLMRRSHSFSSLHPRRHSQTHDSAPLPGAYILLHAWG